MQAIMTGLQEVLPVLDQAQDLLQDEASQRRLADTKGWSSTWSSRPKARQPAQIPTLYMLDLSCNAPAHPWTWQLHRQSIQAIISRLCKLVCVRNGRTRGTPQISLITCTLPPKEVQHILHAAPLSS